MSLKHLVKLGQDPYSEADMATCHVVLHNCERVACSFFRSVFTLLQISESKPFIARSQRWKRLRLGSLRLIVSRFRFVIAWINSPSFLPFWLRPIRRVPWRRGVKRQWGNRKRRFSGLYDATFRHLRKWGQHYYMLLLCLLSPLHWPQNTWPWMTILR